MRFISQYPGYRVQVRPQRVHPLGDGTSQVVQEPLYVTFTAVDDGGMVYEKERYEAIKRFSFHGSQQHQDEATPVDPIHRLSVLDTVEDKERNEWSDEDVQLIEAKLVGIAMTTPTDLIQMEEAPLAAPFPAYDDWTGDGEMLVLKLAEDGFNLEEVLFYERSSYGPRRPEMIEALEIGVKALEEMQVHA